MSHAKSFTFSTAIKKQKNPIFMQWKKNYMVDPKTMDLKVPVQKFSKDSITS